MAFVNSAPPTGVLATTMMLWLGTGCYGNEATEFPPGLEPVSENTAPTPTSASEEFPETLETVHGDNGEFLWSHSRGYVHASASSVWDALVNPQVISDRRNTDSFTVEFDVEPEYDHSMELTYVVNDLITVEWIEKWRYGVIEGDLENPQVIAISFQKVFGTTFIPRLEGSILVSVVGDPDDEIVAIGLIEQLEASRTESDKIAGYQLDIFNNLLATVRGQSLPQY